MGDEIGLCAKSASHMDAESASHTGAGATGAGAVWLVAALCLAVLTCQLNATMVGPVLPDIARGLHVAIGAASWVQSLFFIAGAVAAILLGRLSDLHGGRPILLGVLAAQIAGAVLSALAPSLPAMLGGRLLAATTGVTYPIAFVLVGRALPAAWFGPTLGLITALNGGAAALDGYVAGLLDAEFGFRSVFVAMAIFGALAWLAAWRTVPATARKSGRMDWVGGIALSGALVAASLALGGVSSPSALVWLGLGCLCAGAFVLAERRAVTPLIALPQLASRRVWPLLLTTLLATGAGFAAQNFILPLLAQDRSSGFSLDAAHAALWLITPADLVGLLLAPACGWLAGRGFGRAGKLSAGWLRLLRAGLASSLAVLCALAWRPGDELLVLAAALLFGVTYNGATLTTLNGLGVKLSPVEAPAILPALNGAAFGLGAGLGTALAAPFVAAGRYGASFAIAAALVAMAALASGLIAGGSEPAPGADVRI